MAFRLFGKIPLAISPFFWVTAAIIGWLGSRFFPGVPFFAALLIWVGIIFISILVHELGHALASLGFGQRPRIELVAFGGLTYPEGKQIKKWQEFLVVLCGPLFGFGLFLIASAILALGQIQTPILYNSIRAIAIINFYWTVINLVPVLPLDGGQLLRVIFEGIFKAKGVKYAHFLSLTLSALLCLGSFFIGFFFGGIIFSIFAFQNFTAWRQLRVITDNDRDGNLTAELKEIEELLIKERVEEAIPRLEAARKRAKEGVIFNLTSQYLATFKAQQKSYREVYDLLAPIKKHLTPESQVHLHSAAYEVSDYPLVAELAAVCFRLFPDPLVALHNAEAYAATSQVEPAIGWLKAAHKSGIADLKEIIHRPTFDPIRRDSLFQSFLSSLE
ncbi:MAG: site-2 protease family protein [Chlamydiota bacterium]